jgi:predicted nucleic acid-binding protein
MSYFADSSVLVKLIHPESESEWYRSLLLPAIQRRQVYVASIAPVEMVSAVTKLAFLQRIARNEVESYLEKIDVVLSALQVMRQTQEVEDVAMQMLHDHLDQGLRSLDALQLASALVTQATVIEPEPLTFLTADLRLRQCAKQYFTVHHP